MDRHIYLINLYDYYGNLFTKRQQSYFEDYYFNNLTLSEIGENNNVSRSAVHSQLKQIEKKLYYYEEKLQLYDKSIKIKNIIKDEKLKKQIEELL